MTEERLIELYRANDPWMRRLARKHTMHSDAAEDIVSRVWVNVLLGKIKDNTDKKMNLIFYSCVMNGVRDYFKHITHRERYVEYVENNNEGSEQPTYELGSVGVCMQKLLLLCAGQRRVIELVILQGYSKKEAAAMLGITTDTVRVQLHRGLSWLRKMVVV